MRSQSLPRLEVEQSRKVLKISGAKTKPKPAIRLDLEGANDLNVEQARVVRQVMPANILVVGKKRTKQKASQ
jgi:hypothetical protein